jgi:hypothetical protein
MVTITQRKFGENPVTALIKQPIAGIITNREGLAEIVFKSHASKAFIELVGARPGEGAVGAFAFGRSRGVVEGVLAALAAGLMETRCRASCGP